MSSVWGDWKMKSEHEIAKHNVKWFEHTNGNDYQSGKSKSHLASCQRFLEFLERSWSVVDTEQVRNKIKDLQSAIKEYKGAGIK